MKVEIELDEDHVYHLMDLLHMDVNMYIKNDISKRLLNDSQKYDGIEINKAIAKELKKALR